MSSEADVKFEIGHVLFIDIVGYSKLLIHEQSEKLQKLREIARATEQFRAAEAEGKLLRLPTGDGGALVFRDSPEAPVACAMEISKALKNHPELCVRMGIHSGPVKEVTDLNEQANIAGAGINMAQRVMDCGDAGHILLSKRVADGTREEVRPRLSRIRHLKAIARTSTQQFENTAEQIPDIAKQLGVATILEGSVRKAGDKVRVHVQLIDAENDAHLWAERYDR